MKLTSYVDEFGKQHHRYGPEPHGFCVTPGSTCSMNYCDENGCSDRKRNAVELPTDPEWEAYKEMCAQMEEADNDIDDELTDWYGSSAPWGW